MTGLHGIAVLVVLWCLALLMYHTATGPAIALISVAPASAPCPGDHSSNGSGPSAPAPEGRGAGPGDPVCPLAFDFAHVRLWAAHSVVYCRAAPNATAPNASALRCHFNAHAHNGQADAFCRGTRLVLLPAERALEAACAPVPDAAVPVPLDEFPVFMYDTGLGAIVDDLRMGRARACATSIAGRTYLPLREPGANLFHSFATLFAFFITWTALGSRRDCTIVMLDDHEEGPYWALWSAFCARGVRRLAGLRAEAVCLEEAVLPLAGASAPFWAADRGPIDCPASGLVEAFGRFVRDFHSAAARAPTASTDTGLLRRFSRIPRLTFVVRRGRRELVNGTGWLEDWAAQRSVSLRAVEPHLWPFREQVAIAQGTDVLVAVHGAALTHLLWLPKHAVVLEIMPPGLEKVTYRNLAKLAGVAYLCVRAEGLLMRDWTELPVKVDREAFVRALDAAVCLARESTARQ